MASVIDIIVGINSSAVGTGIHAIKEQVEDMKKEFVNGFAAVASVGFLVESGKEAIEAGAQIADLSKKLAVNTTFFQEVANSATLYGSDIDAVSQSLNKLIINQQKAIDGTGEQRQAFADLGISVDQLKGESPEQIFERIADAVQHAKDRGQAYGDVVEIMGKSSGALVPMLEQGMEKIREEGDAMGVWSAETVAALKRADDGMKVFERRVETAAGNVASNWVKEMDFVSTAWDETQKNLGKVDPNSWGGGAQQMKAIWSGIFGDKAMHSLFPTVAAFGGPDSTPTSGPAIDPDREADAADKRRQALSDAKRLEAQIAEIRKDTAKETIIAQEKAMTDEERLNYFLANKEDLEYHIAHIKDDSDLQQAQYQNEYVHNLASIAELQEKLAKKKLEAGQKDVDEQLRYSKEIQAKEDAIEQARFETRFKAIRKQSDQKIALIAREAELQKEADKLRHGGDEKGALDKELEVERLKAQVAGMHRPELVSKGDSLARVGGGGNSVGGTLASQQLSEARIHTQLLTKIANGMGDISDPVLN